MFAQFYTAQEYEQFLTNLEKERELRLRLSELYRYRENGIIRHEECAHFEQVLAQTQGQNDSIEHWTEKKSVSMNFHLYKLLILLGLIVCGMRSTLFYNTIICTQGVKGSDVHTSRVYRG